MKFTLLLTLVIFLSSALSAQSDYLVTTKRDTISGEISILLPTDYYEEVVIKNDKKHRFKAHQIIGFSTNGDEYHTVKFGQKYRIMKLRYPGYMSLYTFRQNNSFDFGSMCLKKATGKVVEIPNFSFKKIVSEFVEDCPSVKDGVNSKAYKKSNIEEMVKAYNACISSGNVLQAEAERSESVEHPGLVEVKKLSKAISKEEGATMDLTNMVSDISAKLSRGEKIPDYLKSALKEEAVKLPSIRKQVDNLLKSLE